MFIRVHFSCVYAFIGYAMLLLYFQHKRFMKLRHHYLTSGTHLPLSLIWESSRALPFALIDLVCTTFNTVQLACDDNVETCTALMDLMLRAVMLFHYKQTTH